MTEENKSNLYPYSMSLTAVSVASLTHLPRRLIELKQYLPSLKSPLKNSDIVTDSVYLYCHQIHGLEHKIPGIDKRQWAWPLHKCRTE